MGRQVSSPARERITAGDAPRGPTAMYTPFTEQATGSIGRNNGLPGADLRLLQTEYFQKVFFPGYRQWPEREPFHPFFFNSCMHQGIDAGCFFMKMPPACTRHSDVHLGCGGCFGAGGRMQNPSSAVFILNACISKGDHVNFLKKIAAVIQIRKTNVPYTLSPPAPFQFLHFLVAFSCLLDLPHFFICKAEIVPRVDVTGIQSNCPDITPYCNGVSFSPEKIISCIFPVFRSFPVHYATRNHYSRVWLYILLHAPVIIRGYWKVLIPAFLRQSARLPDGQ